MTAHRKLAVTVRLLAVVGLSASVACSNMLDVDNESDILDNDLNTVQAIAPVVAGVAGDFGVLYSQASSTVGIAAFELWHTGSFPSSRQTDDGFLRRPSSDGNGAYNDASRAYWVSGDAQRRIREAFADSADRRIEMAEVIVWGGFVLNFMADNFCSATFNGGPEVSTTEVRRKADEDFTRAITVATAVGTAGNTWRLRAHAGRARARLHLGDYAGAVADAQLITAGFAFNFNYSGNSSREYNYYAGFTRDKYRREAGVHPDFWNAFRGDPRVLIKDWGVNAVGPDAIRRWLEQEKFVERDSDMSVSSWAEVRLIEAEAEIKRANFDRAKTLINQVRAAAPLPAYTGPAAEAELIAQLRYERAAVLWLQGQSLFDLRRFNDPRLNVPPKQGGGATRDKCFEIGQREYETNPNLRPS